MTAVPIRDACASIARRKNLLWAAAGRAIDRGDLAAGDRLAAAVGRANRRLRRMGWAVGPATGCAAWSVPRPPRYADCA